MRIYNTLTQKIEEFKPINPPNVGMYSCGPTVSDFPHIGNLRAYVFVDILRRTLEFNGYKVNHVMNITDVGHLTSQADTGEDKMEAASKREKKDAWQIAKFYEKEFLQALEKLNILKPQIICRATEHIKEMINLVKKLEEKGFAYRISDGIYFDTSKLSDYGKLANMPRSKILAGARIEVVSGKRHPTDFALWKFSPKEGLKRQMEWDSPWGVGFPGWHIECSAMGMKYLNEHFDIHTGGVDHVLIHHTNEIAQNEAATGHQVVNYWIHNEFLLVEGQKMSKSLRNFYNIHDIEKKGFNAFSLRYLFLTCHYRSKMNFTWKGLEAAQNAYNKLVEIIKDWQHGGREVVSPEDVKKIDDFRKKFQEKINDDLNIPEALSIVWEVAKSNIPDPDKLDLILNFDQVLGLDLERVSRESRVSRVPQEITELMEKRGELRKQGKWQEADKIRKQIEKFGFVIEDTPEGPKVKKRVL